MSRHDQLQPSDTLDYHGVTDALDEGYSPPDRAPYDYRHPGEHETLDQRLADEEPDVWTADDWSEYGDSVEAGDQRSGRLAEASDGSHEHNDLYAVDDGIDGAGASAEEAAVHTIEAEY